MGWALLIIIRTAAYFTDGGVCAQSTCVCVCACTVHMCMCVRAQSTCVCVCEGGGRRDEEKWEGEIEYGWGYKECSVKFFIKTRHKITSTSMSH